MFNFSLNQILTKLILLSVIILLIPTQQHMATWYVFNYGPILIMLIIAIILSYCALLLFISNKQSSVNFYILIFFFIWSLQTLIFNGLTILGFWESLNEIGVKSVSGISSYYLAFISVLIVDLVKWQNSDFEKFIKAILIVCLIWGIECIITYYLGYKIPGLESMSFSGDFFDSGFSTNLHIVSKISIIGFWGSIYFYYKNSEKKYMIFSIINLMVLYSTHSKVALGSVLIAFTMFILISLLNRKNQGNVLNKVISLLLIFCLLLGTLSIFNKREISSAGSSYTGIDNAIIANIVHSSMDRIFQYSRAVEVFISNPLGYGAGIGYLIAYSEQVSQPITLDIKNWKTMRAYVNRHPIGGWLSKDLQQEIVCQTNCSRKVKPNTIHNFYLNLIVDYGVFAIVLILIYLTYIAKATILLIKMNKYNFRDKEKKMFGALIFIQINLFIVLQFTSNQKFFSLWVVFILWYFLFKKVLQYEKLITYKK